MMTSQDGFFLVPNCEKCDPNNSQHNKIGFFLESTFSYNECGLVKADGPEMDNP
jgi:hypothetical protein